MCVGCEFLTINVLLLTKSEKKNCTPIIFKNPLKSGFYKKYTFTICVGCVLVVILFFLLEKQTFNGLLKVIGIQSDIIIFLSLQIRDRRENIKAQTLCYSFILCGKLPRFLVKSIRIIVLIEWGG